MIFNSIDEMVGKTPLLRLKNIEKEYGLKSRLYAKLERANIAGSSKDRVALYMIKDAENKGILKQGGTVIEPTSGNTGIGLAAFCASRGYRCILTMPDTMSEERRQVLLAYGAEIHLSKGSEGMTGAVRLAKEIQNKTKGSIIAGQFENSANPLSHYETTAPEIWEDLKGEVDVFVAGIGTGGTISGVGRFLKEKKSDVKIVGVEPQNSPLITKGTAGAHGIMGIGANFIPQNLDLKVIDFVDTVNEQDSFLLGRQMAQKEGVLVGISSGAALFAAIKQARENEDKNIVVLLADSGERYLSTEMFKC